MHDEAVGEIVAVGCRDVMESVKERCSTHAGEKRCKGVEVVRRKIED